MDVQMQSGSEAMPGPSTQKVLKLRLPKFHMLFWCPAKEGQILNEPDYLRRWKANCKHFCSFYCKLLWLGEEEKTLRTELQASHVLLHHVMLTLQTKINRIIKFRAFPLFFVSIQIRIFWDNLHWFRDDKDTNINWINVFQFFFSNLTSYQR